MEEPELFHSIILVSCGSYILPLLKSETGRYSNFISEKRHIWDLSLGLCALILKFSLAGYSFL